MVTYRAKLTGKDFATLLIQNCISRLGFRIAYCKRQMRDITVSSAKCLQLRALHHGGQNTGINRNDEFTSPSTHV